MTEVIYLAPILFVSMIGAGLVFLAGYYVGKIHRRMIDSGQYRGADRD